MESDKAKALDRMMRLCSAGEHCRSDVFRKLENAAVSPADASEIVEKLCAEGYIDEGRFSSAFVHDKSSLQGWGTAKIRMALKRKGIDGKVIDRAISGMDREGAGSKLLAIINAKWKSLSGETDINRKQAKLFRFALGRGYDYSEIKNAYEKIADNI